MDTPRSPPRLLEESGCEFVNEGFRIQWAALMRHVPHSNEVTFVSFPDGEILDG